MRADLEAAYLIRAAIVGCGVMWVSWSMVVNQAMVCLGGPMFNASAAASGLSHVSIFPPCPAPTNPPAAGAITVTAHVTHTLRRASAGGSAHTAVQAVPINVHGGHAKLHTGHTGGVGEALGVARAEGQFLVAEPGKLCALLGHDTA